MRALRDLAGRVTHVPAIALSESQCFAAFDLAAKHFATTPSEEATAQPVIRSFRTPFVVVQDPPLVTSVVVCTAITKCPKGTNGIRDVDLLCPSVAAHDTRTSSSSSAALTALSVKERVASRCGSDRHREESIRTVGIEFGEIIILSVQGVHDYLFRGDTLGRL